MSQIYVVTKKPFEDAVAGMLDHSLESLQSFVGGYIEILPFGLNGEWSIVLNEDGKFSDLEPNIRLEQDGKVYDVIVGPVLVMKSDDEGNSVGLTESEARQAVSLLNMWGVSREESPRYASYLAQFK